MAAAPLLFSSSSRGVPSGTLVGGLQQLAFKCRPLGFEAGLSSSFILQVAVVSSMAPRDACLQSRTNQGGGGGRRVGRRGGTGLTWSSRWDRRLVAGGFRSSTTRGSVRVSQSPLLGGRLHDRVPLPVLGWGVGGAGEGHWGGGRDRRLVGSHRPALHAKGSVGGGGIFLAVRSAGSMQYEADSTEFDARKPTPIHPPYPVTRPCSHHINPASKCGAFT